MTQIGIPISEPQVNAYRAAYATVGRVDRTARGRVWLTGQDRAELLQRLTTNDIVKLNPGQGTRTVLVNSHARILDLLTVYGLPEALLVTTTIGQGNTLARFLQGKIFFGDKVAVEDRSDTTFELHLYGPQAAALVERVTGLNVHEWSLHHIQAGSINGAYAWVARTLPIGGNGFTIIAERDAQPAIEQAFDEADIIDEETLDILRIEAGYPAARHELSTEYIPLETGLTDAVSFNKGCYVGQEIIARMESRNRLAKRMVGLRLDQLVASGSPLQHEGKEVGMLTSAVQSPRFGPIGLGYVRTALATPGAQLQLPQGVGVKVVDLPFAE
jgi:folate-binding protein YgfZ